MFLVIDLLNRKVKCNNFGFRIILILLGLIIIGCHPNENEGLYAEKQNLEDGNTTFQIKSGDSTIIEIGFFKTGELGYVANFPKGYNQMISYHSENGVIESKMKFDKNRKAFGRAYYFFKGSGNLSSDYNYKEGIRTGSAVSYHDSTDRIESIMLYNDSGEMYYRKTFDRNGNLIKEEGSKE